MELITGKQHLIELYGHAKDRDVFEDSYSVFIRLNDVSITMEKTQLDVGAVVLIAKIKLSVNTDKSNILEVSSLVVDEIFIDKPDECHLILNDITDALGQKILIGSDIVNFVNHNVLRDIVANLPKGVQLTIGVI